MTTPINKRPRLYIAGPYTASTPHETTRNILRAQKYARKFIGEGWAVLTPHLNTAGFEHFKELKYEDFIETDLAWLGAADCVFMLDGYAQSKGCNIELDFCREHNIPVIFEDSISSWNFSMTNMLRSIKERQSKK